MATFLEVVNRVLVSLGEADNLADENSSSLSDAYHLKVAQWVNDILEEVEDAAQWRSLRTRDTVTITANGISGSLASSNERSRVFMVHDPHRRELVPLVFDVTDSSNQKQLREMDFSSLLFLDQQNSNAVNGDNGPTHYALSPTASGMDVYVWPRSSGNRSLELDMVIPQSRLDPEVEADLDTTIKVPATLVQLGAVSYAAADRGEELGINSEKAEFKYQSRLSTAVAQEHDAQGLNDLVPV